MTKTQASSIDVSVIYVNWNCADEISASIATVRERTADVRYEIIIVDNASAQGTGTLSEDPTVRLIQSGENRGFGAGCNLGATQAAGRYLLFLNPDTRLLNDVAGTLFEFLEGNSRVAVAGPLTRNERGEVSFEAGRSLPTLLSEFLDHSTLSLRFPKLSWTARPYLSDWDHQSTREVESILGACMLVRADLFRAIGGFDERFFLYSEELDLCYRLREAGAEVWYVHTAWLTHRERQSTIQLFGSIGRVAFQILRSQHYYFYKHHGPSVAFIWRQMVGMLYFVRYVKSRERLFLEYCRWAVSASLPS